MALGQDYLLGVQKNNLLAVNEGERARVYACMQGGNLPLHPTTTRPPCPHPWPLRPTTPHS